MPEIYQLGIATRSASSTSHYLAKAAAQAAYLGEPDLRKRLEGMQRRAEDLHLEAAKLQRELDTEREAA